MQSFLSSVAFVATLATASGALAQDTDKIRNSGPESALAEKNMPPKPVDFVRSSVETADITAENLASLLSKAKDKANRIGSVPDDYIELARVYLGGGHLHEAADVISKVITNYPDLPPQTSQKARALALASFLAGGPETDASKAAFADEWVPTSLWPTIARIKTARSSVAHEHLVKAAGSLGEQSSVLIGLVFPIIFDATIASGDTKLAGELLAAAGQGVIGSNSSQGHYMQGQFSLMQGHEQDAFDAFVLGLETNDLYGAKSRIALADIVLKRPDRKYMPELGDILDEGIKQWRGDEYSLQMMIRFAGVTEELADAPKALRIMTDIRSAYPGTREAELAAERIPIILNAFREAADAGRIEFPTYLKTLRELHGDLREFPEWFEARSTLGDLFGRNGLHAAAAAEFRSIRFAGEFGSNILKTQNSGLNSVSEARAFLNANKPEDAKSALMGSRPLNDPSSEDERIRLGLMTGAIEIENPDFLAMSDDTLRILGGSAYEQEQFAIATMAYETLISRGEALSESQIRRYIHSHSMFAKNENTQFGDPKLPHDKAESLLAAGKALTGTMPELEGLSTETAQMMLSEAENAAEAVKKLLSENRPNPEK